jgi:hypothetical protein
MSTLTQDLLKKHFHYDPLTGNFTRLIAAGNGCKVGEIAGGFNGGYIKIRLLGKKYQAHRLAFMYMTGDIPECVDHIDGDGTNNRWSNLRKASVRENQQNARLRIDNTTGVKGIHLYNSTYVARLWVNGVRKSKNFFAGNYASKAEALAAAESWLRSVREAEHKEFTNHGD